MSGSPRIGFFGRLGSGNLGNDASFEALLDHVRSRHPTARLGAMCSGPERVTERYGIPAAHLHSVHTPPRRDYGRLSGVVSALRVGAGLGVDAVRTANWVRRQDAVFVAGMGVLEATTVIKPWQEPYSLFLLSAFGRVFKTRVALVSVGASPIPDRSTRWLLTTAVRLAHYVSYRDAYSRDALHRQGVVRPDEPVVPDLVFALPMPTDLPERPRSVAVGVMAYWGATVDRPRAQLLHDAYLEQVKRLVRGLLDGGYEVRLLIGDADDVPEAETLLADAIEHWSGDRPAPVDFAQVFSTAELVRRICEAELVVATRYHNVLVALACGKPTVAIAYGGKHAALMAALGLPELCHNIATLDGDLVVEQLVELGADLDGVRATVTERARRLRALVAERLDGLDAELHLGCADLESVG